VTGMASPQAGPLPPRRPPLPRPIPLGYVRLGLLPARRRRLPNLFRPHRFRPPRRPQNSSGGNKSVNCFVSASSTCSCAFKRASQSVSCCNCAPKCPSQSVSCFVNC